MTSGVSERFQGANIVDAGRMSAYWGEHAARYEFARSYVAGRKVLDIACGTGYGIGLLKERAAFIVGVDLDQEAVLQAKTEVGKSSAVVIGNGVGLPFADSEFDIVCSFETLEHLHDRQGLLAEFQRVLRPGGTLLLSTPNADYTQPVDGIPTNPFHIFEYKPDELRSELERFFEIERFLGQTLTAEIRIPPFYDAQRRLPKDLRTQSMLFCWKAFNKRPFAVRESLSEAIWKKPFYPTEQDYCFSEDITERTPVLVAVCKPKK